MRVHLHEGPLADRVHYEPKPVAVGGVIMPHDLPRLGSGCYRVFDVYVPKDMEGRTSPAEACARWGD